MSIITPAARDRCAKESLQEQLARCRSQMQRESGADDMRPVDAHLRHDEPGEFVHMPVDGAD